MDPVPAGRRRTIPGGLRSATAPGENAIAGIAPTGMSRLTPYRPLRRLPKTGDPSSSSPSMWNSIASADPLFCLLPGRSGGHAPRNIRGICRVVTPGLLDDDRKSIHYLSLIVNPASARRSTFRERDRRPDDLRWSPAPVLTDGYTAGGCHQIPSICFDHLFSPHLVTPRPWRLLPRAGHRDIPLRCRPAMLPSMNVTRASPSLAARRRQQNPPLRASSGVPPRRNTSAGREPERLPGEPSWFPEDG